MDKTTLVEQLQTYLVQHAQGRSDIPAPDTLLLDDWFAHSMDVINMALFLEQRFKIKLRDSDLSERNFGTLDSLADFVLARQAAG